MVNQTRASTSNNQDDKELRDTIARLMREEMEKIRPKSAMTNQGGTMVRNQDGSWGKMWLRVFTKKPFYRDLVVLLMTLWLNQRMLSMSLIWKIAYDKLLSRVEISEEQFVSFFLAGLPDDIKLAIKNLVRHYKEEWLSTLEDIKFNDQELRMGLAYKEKYVNLRGSIRPAVQWLHGKQLPKESPLEASNPNIQTPLKLLLEEFADVFAVPKGLPPNISHDHKIPLKEGTPPMNMRPYRHLPTQKDAIEVMVNELLETGIVTASRYVVPTGRYVVPTGKDNVIVNAVSIKGFLLVAFFLLLVVIVKPEYV
ncbi:hypothetical protein Tco_0520835 [Tanacetum coccineum]